jgi:TctA family transporter
VFSTTNSVFQVVEVLFFGIVGVIFMRLRLPITPILLGFVLGPMVEENFRRALQLSHGDLGTFVNRPISASFIAACVLLVAVQVGAHFYAARKGITGSAVVPAPSGH